MLPELVHGFDGDFDSFNIFDSLVDEVWVSEFLGVVSVILNSVLENFKLIKNIVEFFDGSFDSAVILEELSLLHNLSEVSYVFFKTLDVLVVVLFFVVDHWLNLFLDISGQLLDILPVFVDVHEGLLISVLDFLVLKQKLNGLIELINLQVNVFLLKLSLLNVFFNFEQLFDISHVLVLVFGVDLTLGGLHELLKSLNFSRNVFLHAVTNHLSVDLLESRSHVSSVRRSSERHHVALVVLEENSDFDFTLLRSSVSANVLAVVEILNRALNLNSFWFCSLLERWIVLADSDFEHVSSRCSIFAVVISGLNGELNLISRRYFLWHTTWTISQRFDSSGIQEVVEV